jgi:hypothetical protein
MTIIRSIPLIFCNSCGAVSIDTPAFGWKRYRCKDIDVTVCHHCPTCVEYNELARSGLVHGIKPETVATYEVWELAQ